MSEFSITGLSELFREMEKIEPRIQKNIARGMVQDAAKEVRDAMRAAAPVESGPLRPQQVKQGRRHGNLKRSIRAARRRGSRYVVRSTVNILKRAFYWRFVEYGHGGPHPAPPHPFARPAWDAVKHQLVNRMTDYARRRFEAAVRR